MTIQFDNKNYRKHNEKNKDLKQNNGEDVFLLKDGKKIPYKDIINKEV